MTDITHSLPNRDTEHGGPLRTSGLGRSLRAILAAASTLQFALVVTQAILAGLGLDGQSIGASLHETNSTVIAIVAVVQVIAAVLWWRPGRGTGAAPLLAVGLLLAVMAQMAIGQNGVLAVHIPLGVGIIIGSLGMLQLVLSGRRGESRGPRGAC